jgi:hypothetical protein
MNQKFERIEKHLYRRQYQTSVGDWSTLYYAGFKDWKGRQRAFPLGSELKTARQELTIDEARNIRREDFDFDRKKQEPEPERRARSRVLPFAETPAETQRPGG